MALGLVVAACGGDDEAGDVTTTTPPTTAAATTTEATTSTTAATTTTAEAITTAAPVAGQFALTSIVYGAGPMVVITNIGDTSANLGGHWICRRPSYFEIPDVELAPDEFVAINLGGDAFLPPSGVKETFSTSLGLFTSGTGEVALYATRSFDNPEDIIDYVEWGAPDHARSAVAVAAGIWPAGGFVETSDETLSIFVSTVPSGGPEDWVAG